MGSLRDELLKAKLLSEKDVQRLKHEQRVEKKTLGREGLELKKASEAAERKREEAERRERDRKRELERQETRAREELRFKLRDLALSGQLRDGIAGTRRFYFVARNGRIPFLEVSQEAGKDLEDGRLAVVEVPAKAGPTQHVLVPREIAERMAALEPESVRFLNRS